MIIIYFLLQPVGKEGGYAQNLLWTFLQMLGTFLQILKTFLQILKTFFIVSLILVVSYQIFAAKLHPNVIFFLNK